MSDPVTSALRPHVECSTFSNSCANSSQPSSPFASMNRQPRTNRSTEAPMEYEWTHRPGIKPVWSNTDEDPSTPRKREFHDIFGNTALFNRSQVPLVRWTNPNLYSVHLKTLFLARRSIKMCRSCSKPHLHPLRPLHILGLLPKTSQLQKCFSKRN